MKSHRVLVGAGQSARSSRELQRRPQEEWVTSEGKNCLSGFNRKKYGKKNLQKSILNIFQYGKEVFVGSQRKVLETDEE